MQKILSSFLITLLLFSNLNAVDSNLSYRSKSESKNLQTLTNKISKKKNELNSLKKECENKLKKIEKELNDLEIELEALKERKEEKEEISISKVPVGNQGFYDLGSGTGKVAIQAYLYDPKDPQKAIDFIETKYQDIRGEIPDEERSMITRGKGSPVYGEIKPNSMDEVFKKLNVKGFKKVVGIELSPTRFHHSETINKKVPKIKGKTLQFLNENIAESDFSDADIIYMCSTCYPDELMELLVDKFCKLKNGVIVISLKSLPNYEQCGLELMTFPPNNEELSLAMTWSESSPVHIYKLDKSKAKSNISKPEVKEQVS